MRRFLHDRRAVSAVEFAMLLPLLLILYLGGNDISQAVSVYRKVSNSASVVGDLVAQVSTLTTAEADDILSVGRAVMSPFDASTAQIGIAAVMYDDAQKKFITQWRRDNGKGGFSDWVANAPFPLAVPDTFKNAGFWVIVSQVKYTYTSPLSTMYRDLTNGTSDSIAMADIAYLRPRISNSITLKP
jgi:Flp pilus assembly protein TadG